MSPQPRIVNVGPDVNIINDAGLDDLLGDRIRLEWMAYREANISGIMRKDYVLWFCTTRDGALPYFIGSSRKSWRGAIDDAMAKDTEK